MSDKQASPSRRGFLRGAATTAGAAAALGLLPPGIRRALAIPAAQETGTISDVKHVVIFMQENRSFDHYFGTLRGVRGFGDRFPVPLANGKPVWQQPPTSGSGACVPFRYDTTATSAQRTTGMAHSWSDGQQAWNGGRMNQWVAAKTARALGYYTQSDIAYQFALADAFTCAMPTTAANSPAPTRTVCSSGAAPTTRWDRAAVPRSTTRTTISRTRPATTGPPTPSAWNRPA